MKQTKNRRQDWKIAFADNVIAEMLDYRGVAILCDDEDCIGDDCPTCGAMRKAIENCEGIVRAAVQ